MVLVVMMEEVFALFLLRSVAGVAPVYMFAIGLGACGNMVTSEVNDPLR